MLMKSILVPTDFSDCANAAAEVAVDIAKRSRAEIIFLHMHKPQYEGSHAHTHGGSTKKEHCSDEGHARNELNELIRKAEHHDLKAKPAFVFDNGNERIETYVQTFNIDFIVMGSHGANGIKEAFIGSNTQRVVRDSTVPVLIVKRKTDKFEPKKVVFASSFEEDVGKPFEFIVDFATTWEANLHLLYVNMPFNFKETDQATANMQNFADKYPGASINIYDAFNEERGIKKFASEIKADLIAMTTHGRTGFIKMISHSIAESLMNHAEVPILIVNTRFTE